MRYFSPSVAGSTATEHHVGGCFAGKAAQTNELWRGVAGRQRANSQMLSYVCLPACLRLLH